MEGGETLKLVKLRGAWVLASVFLAWAVVATSIASYYFVQYTNYYGLYEDVLGKLGEVSITVGVAIDYGNGTRVWCNGTVLPIGATLFNATLKVSKYEYKLYDGKAFTTAINDVKQKPDEKMYWTWWYWNEAERKWILGPVACNDYMLRDGHVVIWYYSKVEAWPPTPPE